MASIDCFSQGTALFESVHNYCGSETSFGNISFSPVIQRQIRSEMPNSKQPEIRGNFSLLQCDLNDPNNFSKAYT